MSKKKPQLSDQQLFDLAEENEVEAQRIAKLVQQLDKNKAEVIAELEARGTQALEHGGYRINGVWANDTWIDETGLLLDLPKPLRKKVTKRVLDKKRLSQAVQAGEIDPVVLAAHSGTKPKKPYYRFTKVDRKGKK